MSLLSDKKILVTGGHGFLGSYVYEYLLECGVDPSRIFRPKSSECDLRLWEGCVEAVKNVDVVIHIAGKTGGIGYNRDNPGTLFYDNLIMNTQMMEASRRENVEKFVGIGTVCSYPKETPVPFREENLWNGYPEETNAPYGLSKKMMAVQSKAYHDQFGFNSVHLLMVNLYGPRDDFDPARSHVVAALVKKFADAVEQDLPSIEIWGTGSASREFLYVKDAARGIVMAAEALNNPEPVNLGAGMEITIRELVEKLTTISGFSGDIVWDTTKPDGQPRRSLDTSRAEEWFGFKADTGFDDGLEMTYRWYVGNISAQ